jgi:hypothetical protein
MTTTATKKSNKSGIVFTYIVALLCLIAGFFAPLYGNATNLADKMLFMYLPNALNNALGQTIIKGDIKTEINVTLAMFGNDVSLISWTTLLYAVITVLGIIFLIPVIAGKKEKKGYTVCAYIIEVAALVVLTINLLLNMDVVVSANYKYAFSEIDDATFAAVGEWKNFAILIAFGGTLLMLIIQSIMNKKGLGVCKLFLYLFSAIAMLMMYDIYYIIPSLADPLLNLRNAIGIELSSSTGPTNPIIEFFNYYVLDIQNISTLLGEYDIKNKVLFISLMALATLGLINLIIDTISLATNSKYDAEGRVNVNAGTKIFGLVRYTLEILAAFVAIIMILVLKYKVGLYLYVLMLALLIQFFIELIRVCLIKKVKKQTATARKMEFADEELTSEATDEIVIAPEAIGVVTDEPIQTNNASTQQFVYPAETTEANAKETAPEQKEEAKPAQTVVYTTESTTYTPASEQANQPYAQSENEQIEIPVQKSEPEHKPENTYVYNVRAVYNGPTDKFMDTLTDEEKIEFHQVFIEKSKGTLPRIPDYVIGGNNSEFFPQVFIYLGKFRNILSSNLLAKIYKQLNANN